MKLKEIEEYYVNLTDQQLHEVIEKDNQTGFLTEDLVKIVRASQDDSQWSKPMTCEDFMSYLDSLVEGKKS